MPGMNSGVTDNDPTVVAAFRAALAHQGVIALLIVGILAVVWVAVRERRQASGDGTAGFGAVGPVPAEAAGRQVLRIGFGLLWLLDGLLQAQPDMAVGLPSGVIQPTAETSPLWVQHLVNWAGTSWSYHPIQAAAATVWIQVGIGLWLLAARRGTLSRLAGVAGVGWGLIVWVFGESFGGIFAPGLSWLTGAPGAALIYCAAGALLVLPQRYWRSPRLGRAILAGLGAFMIGMAVLQAWPGRGFWQGSVNGGPGALAGSVQSMVATPQPGFLSGLVSSFGSFARQDGFGVNLVAVIVMAAAGVAFLTGRRRVIVPATWAFAVFCLADWILIEDLGFLGGLGTDPNNMIPTALVGVAGLLACTRVPQAAADAAAAAAAAAAAPDGSGRGRRWAPRLAAVRDSLAAATFGTMASFSAVGVIVLGAAPLAAAQASPAASTVLAQAVDGPASTVEYPAPGFTLTDQRGQRVSLPGLRGKTILLTFLDPVCVSDCPLIAQEFRQAGQLLGASNKQVELVAVNLNPMYGQLSYIQTFDRQEELASVPNWLYLTGSPAALTKIYAKYGVASQTLAAGAMLGHSDIAFVIDKSGMIRDELDFAPGPGTSATKSSFASELASAATQILRAS
jgi:cytochrome oxidase Cu insertion factor (SCO1/SenC/PrrC family)